jgi:broad specificity phosphatase PhoE
LDAEDPNWYQQSPTPYDAPLTFGGWNQSKLLGSRIADLLTTGRNSIINESKQAARQPVRIVIHSSPFQRCTQTAVGIAAGILQHDRAAAKTSATHGDHGRSIPEVDDTVDDSPLGKPLLRIDAFLGEWLSLDYFRDITPPPSSPLMVLSAKADLLADDDVEFIQPSPLSIGNFPGGWTTTTQTDQHDDAMSLDLNTTLSRHRSNSYGQVDAIDADDIQTNPSYAASPSDPIPRGYVAHARSTCLEVDRNWDSSRETAGFGTGGEFGEEWSAMHDRLNAGICKLIAWYGEHLPEAGLDSALDPTTLREEDDDALLVVILVTHNTGCNALLRALTNRPVLIDVDQASLTVAARTSDTLDHSSDIDPARLYRLKIRASTDHLHKPFRPLQYGKETGGIKGLWTLRRQIELGSSQQTVSDAPSTHVQRPPGLWETHHLTKRRWTTSTNK